MDAKGRHTAYIKMWRPSQIFLLILWANEKRILLKFVFAEGQRR
jgi:hypothetical protein